MLTEIFVCNKFLYDHGHGHGYTYRKPVYFLFLYSVVEYQQETEPSYPNTYL
jgi:hypothetical protein